MKIVKVGSTKITGHPIKQNSFRAMNNEAKKALADKMRDNPTDSELIVFQELKRRGCQFKFQHLLHGYIADFYFPHRSYVLELDGRWHTAMKDDIRDQYLLEKGIRTLRIASKDVFHSLKWVMVTIFDQINPPIRKPKPKRKKKRIGKLEKRLYQDSRRKPDESMDSFLVATAGL